MMNKNIFMLINVLRSNARLFEFFNHSFWSFLGTAISKFMLLLIWIIIARILEPNSYGEFSLIRNTALLFAEFIAFSLSIVATKFVAENFNKIDSIASVVLNIYILCISLGLCFMLIIYIHSDFISSNILKTPHFAKYISIVSLIVLISAINNCQLGILRGFGEYKLIARLNVYQLLPSFPIFILLTYAFKLEGAVWAYVFYNLISLVFTQYFIILRLKYYNISISNAKFDLKLLKLMFYLLIPYFLSVFMGYFAGWYNEIQLVSIHNNGFTLLGEYSAILTIQNVIISSIIVLCVPLISMMSKYKSSKDKSIECYNYYIPIFLSIFTSVVFILIPEIFVFIYGSDYFSTDLLNIIVVLISCTPIISFRQALARSVAVHEKQNVLFFDTLLYSTILIFSFQYFINEGIWAIVLSSFISNLISVLIFFPVYNRLKIIPNNILYNKGFIVLVFIYLIAILSSFIFSSLLSIRIFLCSTFYLIFFILSGYFIRHKWNAVN